MIEIFSLIAIVGSLFVSFLLVRLVFEIKGEWYRSVARLGSQIDDVEKKRLAVTQRALALEARCDRLEKLAGVAKRTKWQAGLNGKA